MGNTIYSNTAFLHDLKKSCLGFRRSTVDLITKKQMTVCSSWFIFQFTGVFIVYTESGNIGRHGIRCKLDTFVRKPKCS